jgi:hypothetical protein
MVSSTHSDDFVFSSFQASLWAHKELLNFQAGPILAFGYQSRHEHGARCCDAIT